MKMSNSTVISQRLIIINVLVAVVRMSTIELCDFKAIFGVFFETRFYEILASYEFPHGLMLILIAVGF